MLSPARRFTWLDWIALGPLTDYPESQTRLAEYVNPFKKAWDGETAKIPCWVRRMTGNEFQVFAINCTHLGCPVRWFAESSCSCAPATVAYSTPTVDTRRDHRRGRFINTNIRWSQASFGSMPANCRRWGILKHDRSAESIGRWLDTRLQIGDAITSVAEHPVPRTPRVGGTSSAARRWSSSFCR